MPPSLVTVADAAVPRPLFADALRGLRRVGDRATYWKTFWYPLDAPPSNVIEALIPALREHLPRRPIRGVEWWIGRMRTTNVPLDFHHDRDLRLFETTGRLRHPVFSSVLFFNRVRGGSLFVTDQELRKRSGMLVLDPTEAHDFFRDPAVAESIAWFPGNLHHGVLDANDQVPRRRLPGPPARPRLTVILNWWDRPPLGVKPWATSGAYPELGRTSLRFAARR